MLTVVPPLLKECSYLLFISIQIQDFTPISYPYNGGNRIYLLIESMFRKSLVSPFCFYPHAKIPPSLALYHAF